MTKEEKFYQLHHNGKLLILPNIWDPMGAILLQDLGYPAVATASSSLALSNGYPDGEKLPFEELLSSLRKIVKSVSIPVTADVESGYAGSDLKLLRENIKKLIGTGIAGINFEDSIHGQPGMIPVKEQAEKIRLIRKTAEEEGSRLFINERVDVYIKGDALNDDEKLAEAIKRGKVYKESGADALYPIILRDQHHIDVLVQEVGLPLNLTLIPGIPDFDTLKKLGVARLSLASGFFKLAVTSMKNAAEKLLKYQGMELITDGLISSDYLSGLVKD